MEDSIIKARTLVEAVCMHAARTPEARAVVDNKGIHTYRDIWSDICICAKALSSLGIRDGSRLVMECSQDELFLAVNLACQLSGGIFVGVERRVAPDRLKEIVRQTGSEVLLTRKSVEETSARALTMKEWDALCAKIRETSEEEVLREGYAALKSIDPENTAEILFSTGTTGKSKGVMLSGRANIANAQNIIAGTCMRQDSVELMPLPLNHAHGLRTAYAHLLNGSTVLIANGITLPRVLLDMMEKHGATALDLTPSAAQMLLKTSYARLHAYAQQIDYIEVGAAFLPESTKEKLRECFPDSRLYNCYGSSESGRTCYLDFNKDACRPGSIGRPVPNARFAVMGPDHKPIESNPEHTGLLASAGPMNMSGYWGEPGLTAETVQDGYVMTADMSYIDPDGYVYVLGRADDVINYKGIKISPEEIEEAASGCAMVADCACIPMEDELAGQVPKLFVVPAEGIEYSEAELFAYLKEHIDDNRMPRIIELIDVIPRTYNGKVLRRELAAR